ncbi:Uncharacterised protein [Neisseria meningitidis]|nr:Uncharacterised protein [Neisseria meningitidis]
MIRRLKVKSRLSQGGKQSSDWMAAYSRSNWIETILRSLVLMEMTAKTTLSALLVKGASCLIPASGKKYCCLGRFVLPMMTVNLTHSTKKKTTASQNTVKNTAAATAASTSAIWATSSTAPSWRSASIWLLPPTTGWCISSNKAAGTSAATI